MTQVAVKTLAQHDDLMKKTETMSILIESNKLLREEKEKAEQKLEQAQAKVSMQKYTLSLLYIRTSARTKRFNQIFRSFQLQKMESDILPLQQANSELSEKSGMLQAEKKILEDEIKQWKARTQVGEEK